MYDRFIDRDMLFSVLNIRTKAPKITSLLKTLSPDLFNNYMDFVLKCVEHDVLL